MCVVLIENFASVRPWLFFADFVELPVATKERAMSVSFYVILTHVYDHAAPSGVGTMTSRSPRMFSPKVLAFHFGRVFVRSAVPSVVVRELGRVFFSFSFPPSVARRADYE